jgi:dihydrofolate synthase/folylpolyglutamate synthase
MTVINFPYYNAVDQIYNAEWTLGKLARLELLTESIHALWPQGHPTRLIHVVGTSGKGSTSRFLEMGLLCQGKAGAFMSPHLFDYRERFSINGEFASQTDVTWAWEQRVRPHCVQLALRNPHQTHTFHEVSILIALALFEQHEVTWAAIEASIGGRYDQTRALEVVATVLTNVGSDHQHLLGKEQWQRVLDKAGAARSGVPFFTSEQEPANLTIIQQVCQTASAPFYWLSPTQMTKWSNKFHTLPATTSNQGLIEASYQKWNAALALEVIAHLCPQVDQEEVLGRLERAQLLGRLWKVAEGLYADVAHNSEKVRALAGEVETRFGALGKILVIGLSGHRVAREVFAPLVKLARAIVVTSASFKGQEPEKIYSELAPLAGDRPLLVVHDPQQALHVAQSMRRTDDVVIITGSTYTIEQALNPDPYLRYLNSSFGWRSTVDTEAYGVVQLTLPKPPPRF